MDVRSALFGSTLRAGGTVVVGLLVLGAAAFALGVVGVPGVVGVENAFGGVNGTTTEIRTDLTVHNPNPVGVTLGELAIDYGVTMNDVRVAGGQKRGLSVGTGNSTLNFTTLMRNDRIPAWWVTHIRNGENTTLAVNATVRSGLLGRSATVVPVQRPVATDIIGQFNSTETREVNADVPLVSDPVAYVNRTNATWGAVSESRTPIDAEIGVYNPKPYPLAVNELGYNITMNGVAMGEGHTERSYTIPPNTERTLDARLVMRNDNIDDWWVSHLERNQRTNLEVDFYLRVDGGGATVRLPLRGLTNERVIETDFFGNKNVTAAANGSDSDGDDSETDNGTTTTTSEEATTDGGLLGDGTTEETTATEKTTTTTTTDDGGLLARVPSSGVADVAA